MELDALMLSRIQFAFTISFHIIFPAFTIGLASWLALLEFNWLRTRQPIYRSLYNFWVKVFAVSFGLGVVSGLVMSYQFGTNWSGYSDFGGDVLGPLIGYEVITAFFLEASFLGIMLFGWSRVGDRLHFLATCLVALGTLISAFWILSANSFMQTPAGYEIIDGRLAPANWVEIIFNPSFPYRFAHMVTAAYLTTAFAVAGLSAWMILRHRIGEGARRSLSMAMWAALFLAPLQLVLGDLHGLNTSVHQPAKLAAMEAHWENEGDEAVPLVLFAIPDREAERNRYEIAVPMLGSLIIKHSTTEQFPGLKEFPEDERPPIMIPFFAFRIMVGIGLAMIGMAAWSLFLRFRGRLSDNRAFLTACVAMLPSGFIAVLCGWFTTEVGRQPWVIYGLLRTEDALSPVSAGTVGFSLIAFIIAYAAIFGAGTYYLFKLMAAGPQPYETQPDDRTRTAKRPMSASDEPVDGGERGEA